MEITASARGNGFSRDEILIALSKGDLSWQEAKGPLSDPWYGEILDEMSARGLGMPKRIFAARLTKLKEGGRG